MPQPTEQERVQLEEKLKQMGPEELSEFQKKNCIFCNIINGKIPSKKVYEDSDCVAILDIHPANPGHILVLPKEHYAVMPQLPIDILQHCFVVAKAMSKVMLQALNAQGTNILVANGPAAGQKANHFLIHLIPRKTEDGINLSWHEQELSADDISKLKSLFRVAVAKMFGAQKETPGDEKMAAPKTSNNTKKQDDLNLDEIAKLLSK